MPANKNAMTRYKILDELLSNRYHNYSLDDLTEEVSNRLTEIDPETNGVVRRTIEKDLYYLEYASPFMVDIERYSVPSYNAEKQKSYIKQCLRYSDPSFSIFVKSLTDDEEYLLKEALSLLGQFDGLPNLKSLEGIRLGLGVGKEKRQIISFSKNPLEESSILGELFTSISQRQVISITYHKFGSSEYNNTINLYPYLLKEYNRRWYLFGAAEKDGKMLRFALDRIDRIVALPSHRFIDYDGDINELFDDIVGITLYDDALLYNIYIWVSDFSKDYIETKPIHDSQRYVGENKENAYRKEYPMLKGGKFYRIDCKVNYELIRELSSFGKDLLVIEPTAIQDMVWDRISAMTENYLKLRTKNS